MDELHVIDLLPGYALGILDEKEMGQVADHLTRCASCREELEAHLASVALLGAAAAPVEPPPGLKKAILERVAPAAPAQERAARPVRPVQTREPKKESLLERLRSLGFWQAGLALAVLLLAFSNLFLWSRLNSVQSSRNGFETVAMAGTADFAQASGVLIISHDGKYGTLVVDDLPALEPDKAYQLWLIDAQGERTSGGIFTVSKSGYGALEIWSPEALDSYPAFGITIEPQEGSPQPTGEKVMGGEL